MVQVFCNRLNYLRTKNKLSFKQLSKQTGFSDIALNRWEQGTRIPTINTLIILAKFFNVSTDYLIGLKDE